MPFVWLWSILMGLLLIMVMIMLYYYVNIIKYFSLVELDVSSDGSVFNIKW